MIVRGVVVKGQSLGRRLGFPTANIALDGELPIERGVYRSKVRVCGSEYKAISNVGVKPTVGTNHIGLECHILDFDGDLYGQEIEVELLERLRAEIRFESIELLREQIEKDIEIVKNIN